MEDRFTLCDIQWSGYPDAPGIRPSILITFIPDLTSPTFTKLMAQGKRRKASFCMPTEGTIRGSASASPRNTCAVQYILYSPSDIPRSFSKATRSGHPEPRVTSWMGWPPGHERFSPANIFRRSPGLRLVAGLLELTTTAMSSAWAVPLETRERTASPRRSRVVIDLTPMLAPASKSKRELQLQAIQVWLAGARGVVQLSLKGNVVIQVEASAERRTIAQADVVEDRVAVRVRVHILIAEKRPQPPQLLGELRIERWLVEVERTTDNGLPDQEPLVQKFNAMRHVDHVGVDDRLAVPRRRSENTRKQRSRSAGKQVVMADLVVVIRSSDLQPGNGVRTKEETSVHVVAIVLIGHLTAPVEFRPNGVRGAVFSNVVQPQLFRGNRASHGNPNCLRGKQPAIAGVLHHQRPICCCLQPGGAAERPVVIPDVGLVTAKGKFQVVVPVVLEQHPSQIDAVALGVAFLENNLGEHAGFVRKS